MRDGWFYNEQEKPVGPFSMDALISYLRKQTDPHNVKVWNTGYKDWRLAKDVPQIAELIFRPPPISKDAPSRSFEAAAPEVPSATLESKQKSKRRWVAFLIVLFFVLAAGAILSSNIYNNSAEGIGRLFGELIGIGIIPAVIGIPARRETYTPAVVLAAAALGVVISNASQLMDSIDARKGIQALGKNAVSIEQVAKENPSNSFVQLISGANKIAQETSRAVIAMSAGIEPPALSKDVNYSTITHAELKTLLSGLKTAELNAEAAMPRFTALYKKERDQLESLARSLNVSDDVRRSFMGGVDKRQVTFLAFTSKMMTARAELYRGLKNYVAILDEQYGNYSVQPNGQLLFADRSVLERFNAAANSANVASKKINALEAEGKQLQQSQQEEWERVLKGQVK